MKTFAENLAELIAGEVARAIQSAAPAAPPVTDATVAELHTPDPTPEPVAPIVASEETVPLSVVNAKTGELEGRIEKIRLRRNYWRQMTSEAREYLRAQDKKLTSLSKDLEDIIGFIRTAQGQLATTQTEIKAMRLHWIGPKLPVKDPQRPHRSTI